MKKTRPNIVVLGGGTGSFSVLSSLRDYDVNLTAIVSMADDGSSTGLLRDELGVLPPGDVRQCLVALSSSPSMRDLFNYRFEEGSLSGHSFGNLFLAALEKTDGDFAHAVERASDILRIKGKVLPATLDNVRLAMRWDEERIELHGERVIDADHFALDPRKATLELVPAAQANPRALKAIAAADLVVIAPGDLYTSLGPLLVIKGIGDALLRTNARVLYISNLVTKHGQTDGFSVEDHVRELERFTGTKCINTVLYNTEQPPEEIAERYTEEQAFLVLRDESDLDSNVAYVGEDLLGAIASKHAGDHMIARSLIRHDYEKLGAAIIAVGDV